MIKKYYYPKTSTTYTVTYDSNGGTGTMIDHSSPYNSGSTVTVLSNGFNAPTGYEFVEWNTSSDGSGTIYDPSDTFVVNADVTLYAQWQSTTGYYTVSFNLNGHGTSETPADQTVQSGGYATKPSDPTDTTYIFAGWFANAECTGVIWDFAAYTVNNQMILYAKWTNPSGIQEVSPFFPMYGGSAVFGYLYSNDINNPVDTTAPIYVSNVRDRNVSSTLSFCILESNYQILESPKQNVTVNIAETSKGTQLSTGKWYTCYILIQNTCNYECIGISINDIASGKLIPVLGEKTKYVSVPNSSIPSGTYTMKYCEMSFENVINTDQKIIPILQAKST